MSKFNAIKTVYSYYLPETRAVVDQLVAEYPHDVFLRSTTGAGLDEFEQPVIEKFMRFQKDAVPGLDTFKYRYWTAGAEEGIREYMTTLATDGIENNDGYAGNCYVRPGEYEGYEAVGRTRGIGFKSVPSRFSPREGLWQFLGRREYDATHPYYFNGTWFVSNPSAKDGNIIPNERINEYCDCGHKVFYDLSYLGSTQFHKFDIHHENIDAVAISFSKPYGLFYYRIGMLFSRREIPGLYGNRWFKNVFSIMLADRLMIELGNPMVIPQRYKALQDKIVKKINLDFKGMDVRPSDSFLLANRPADRIPPMYGDMLMPLVRDDVARLCLTKYYEDAERKGFVA